MKDFQKKVRVNFFFRKGKIGEWEKDLSVNLIKKIEKTFSKEMIELGYL